MKDKTGILEALQGIDQGVLSPQGFRAVWQALEPVVARLEQEQAEGAQGERERFIAFAEVEYRNDDEFSKRDFDIAQRAWNGRAALAQPSPAPELERPEVVVRVTDVYPVALEVCGGLTLGDELVIGREHDRIVGALRAQIERFVSEGITLADQRDAALSRLAELEKQEPVAWMLADAVGGSVLEFQKHDLIELQNRYGGEIVPVYADPAAQAGQVPIDRELLRRAVTEGGPKGAQLRREVLALLDAAPQPAGGADHE